MKRIIPLCKWRRLLNTILLILFSLVAYATDNKKLPVQRIDGVEYFIYESKKTESLYGIAKRFGWDIEELRRINPDISGTLHKGNKVYYPVNSAKEELINVNNEKIESTPEKNKTLIHIVKKGENIYGIAREYGVPLNLIYEINPNVKKGVKIGEPVIIPVEGLENSNMISKTNENIEINDKRAAQHSEIEQDHNNKMPENKVEVSINDNYYNKDDKFEDKKYDTYADNESIPSEGSIEDDYTKLVNQEVLNSEILKIALILDDPNSNKDIDFTRGLLLGLKEFKTYPKKIDLKIIDGRNSTVDLEATLDDYEPSMIISSADKAFPAFLADYGNTNRVEIINVFDLKNGLYEDNKSIIQMLLPSSIYSQKIANKIYRDNKDRYLIYIGTPEANEAVGIDLLKFFEDETEIISLEEFGSYNPLQNRPLLIYSSAIKKEEIADFMQALDNISEIYPETDLVIVGRSNWITLVDEFGNKFEEHEIILPARIWLDEDSEEWHDFLKVYEEIYGGSPVRSIPNFSAYGYDIINYFLTTLDEHNGIFTGFDNNNIKSLQSEIILRRPDPDGGLINDSSYLLKFSSTGKIDKILVK